MNGSKKKEREKAIPRTKQKWKHKTKFGGQIQNSSMRKIYSSNRLH